MVSLSLLSFPEFYSLLNVSMVAVPTGYKIIISHALGMHGIYCSQPSGHFAPSCFSAINAIHPSLLSYNHYLMNRYMYLIFHCLSDDEGGVAAMTVEFKFYTRPDTCFVTRVGRNLASLMTMRCALATLYVVAITIIFVSYSSFLEFYCYTCNLIDQ